MGCPYSDCSNEFDQWSSGRETFLSAARQRQSLERSGMSLEVLKPCPSCTCTNSLFGMHILLDERSVGPEHCLLGCAAVLRLPRCATLTHTHTPPPPNTHTSPYPHHSHTCSKVDCNAVQVTLLAVRKSSRRLGLGRYLMQVSLPTIAVKIHINVI